MEVLLEIYALTRFIARTGVLAITLRFLGVDTWGTIWASGVILQLVIRAGAFMSDYGKGVLVYLCLIWTTLGILAGILGIILLPVSYLLSWGTRLDMKIVWATLFIVTNFLAKEKAIYLIRGPRPRRRYVYDTLMEEKIPLRDKIKDWILGT